MHPWRKKLLIQAALVGLLALIAASLSGQWLLSFGLLFGCQLLFLVYPMVKLGFWLLEKTPHEQISPIYRGLSHDIKQNAARTQSTFDPNYTRLWNILERVQSSTFALNEGLVVLDNKNKLQWCNLAAQKLLGFEPSQTLGQAITQLLEQPDFSQYLQEYNYQQPYALKSPLNPRQFLQLSITPFGQGERLIICRDVSRLIRLEQMRKDFIANLSHELRTPLTVITGYLETMSDAPTTSQWKQPIEQMEQQAKRLDFLLKDLLLLSSLEIEQKQEPQNQAVEVEPLIEEISQSLLPLLSEQHQLEIKINSRCCILGDKKELFSAFSNLLTNAIIYSPEGGKITICWKVDEQGGILSVTDSGVGIDPKHQSRLTERFYRANRGRTINKQGTGLGLAIVKHVLMRHEAKLTIRSEPQKGSCFRCHFSNHRLDTPKAQSTH